MPVITQHGLIAGDNKAKQIPCGSVASGLIDFESVLHHPNNQMLIKRGCYHYASYNATHRRL